MPVREISFIFTVCHRSMIYVISCFIVFYFLVSGHGSQLADVSGDEEDGWDECMSIFF
jgi:hypothetical protein